MSKYSLCLFQNSKNNSALLNFSSLNFTTMKNYLPTLDDMVFEHRNKLYGAFDLRKSYTDSLKKATLFGISVVLFLSGSSFIYYKGQPKEIADGIVLDMTKWVEPPLEDDVKIIPPPPPVVPETPPEVKQVAFLPPEPKEDVLVIEEIVPPKVSEMDNAQISNVNRDGVDATTIVFDAPPPVPVFTKEVKESGMKAVDLPFTNVEMMPEFIGGTTELYKWLANNLRYPTAAVNAGVEGKVFVKFIVEKDGTISKLEVLKGIGFGCDEEALRTLQKMPKWSPGKQNGRAVRVYFTLPISFKLQ